MQSSLDEIIGKMSELLVVLRVQSSTIDLKINVNNTKPQRLGRREDKKRTLGSKNINQVDSFTYLGSIISKDNGCSEDVKSKIAKTQGGF